MAVKTTAYAKFFILYLIAVSLAITSSVVAKAVGLDSDKSMKDVISGSGLYNKSDKVTILNATTFANAITNSKQAWIVEFYNSWCGHCIRYAPTWKEFAASVYGWRNVVRVAVVDCVVEVNTPLCREYEIMYYPAVKFFPAHSKDSLGNGVEKGSTANSLRKVLAETLVMEQQEGRGTDWPNLTPYRSGNLHNLWKDISSSVKYAVLIFTDTDSDIGVEFVLEMSSMPSIQARVALSDNEILAKSVHVLTYPTVILVDSSGTTETVQTSDKSFKGLLIATQSALKLKGIEPLAEEEIEIEPIKLSGQTPGHPYQIEALEVAKLGDVAFLSDMERAVRYSLEHEIAAYNTIKGKVVYDYLTIIHNYFPHSAESRQFFELLVADMKESTTLSGKEWKEKLSKAEMQVPGPVWGPWTIENTGWLGCQGSQPKYRGYPCALWTTFHTLTVNAMEEGCKHDATFVLRAILGYVKNFFGCSECAQHFNQMASDDDFFAKVTSCEGSAQWLWNAHNMVNKRLKNDSTADPVHPKIQFPSEEHCGECYNNSNWVVPNVLKYLSRVYGHKNINQLGAKHSFSKETNPVAESFHLVSSGWIMSPLDLSLWVVLYIFSGIIIMIVWFKFLMRRSYKKKAYIHDLLGKV